MNKQNRILLGVMRDRKSYNKIVHLLSEDDFPDILKIPVRLVQDYYEEDPDATRVDPDWLSDKIVTALPSPKHHAPILSVINTDEEVSIPNAVQDYLEIKKASAARRLGERLVDPNSDKEEVDALLEEYVNATAVVERREEDTFINPDLDMLLESIHPDNLIKVIPKSLNDRLDGGLVPGSMVAVYAPTEVGKSMFTINIACGMLNNGYRVLYCGNEDPPKQMLLRIYSRLSGMTKQEMAIDPGKAKELAFKRGLGNLIFKSLQPGTVGEIRRLVEKHRPQVLVVDQMANMETPTAFTKVEKNEYLAAKLRSLTQKNGLATIIVHQASDSAYGKLILNKNDMYFSNVGVQGQMDVMIGIGMDEEYDRMGTRMICLTKNKLSSNHDCFPVKVNPLLTKVYDE